MKTTDIPGFVEQGRYPGSGEVYWSKIPDLY